MTRDNARWISELSHAGPVREQTLGDLRAELVRNLRAALRGRAADEGFIEDTVQDALVRILERLEQFAGRSRFVTWATSIAIHGAFTELRRKRWQDVSLDEVVGDGTFSPERAVDSAASPTDEAARRAVLEAMQRVIERDLTEKQRTALLAELKGMPQADIARHLSSNRNAVYKLTHDARKKLKRGLEAAGYAADDVVGALAR